MLNLSIYMNLGKAGDFFKRVERACSAVAVWVWVGTTGEAVGLLWGNRVPVLL